jgi:hypothetical protein
MSDTIQKLLGYMQSNPNFSHCNSRRRMRRLGYDAIFKFIKGVSIVLKDDPTPVQDESIFLLVNPEVAAIWDFNPGELCAVGLFVEDAGCQRSCRSTGGASFPCFDPEDLEALKKDGIITCVVGSWKNYLKEDQDD